MLGYMDTGVLLCNMLNEIMTCQLEILPHPFKAEFGGKEQAESLGRIKFQQENVLFGCVDEKEKS